MEVTKLLENMREEISTQSYLNIIQMMMAIEVIRDRVCGNDKEAYELATKIRKQLHKEE